MASSLRRNLTPWVLLSALGMAAPAWAAPPKDTHLDLLSRTSLPVFLGGRLQAETPRRIRVGLNIGWLPPPYLELFNRASGARFWESFEPNSAVSLALDGSFVGGVDVGWRPFKGNGFVFDAGYQFVALNGDQLGVARPESSTYAPSPEDWQIDISTILHMVTLEVGYEHVIDDRLVIRADFGGAFTLGTTSWVSSRNTAQTSTTLVSQRESELAERYTEPLNTPTLTVSIGYRFF